MRTSLRFDLMTLSSTVDVLKDRVCWWICGRSSRPGLRRPGGRSVGELMGLVPTKFGAYGKLCADIRCPSSEECDVYFHAMIDSTKLEEITNQFEGQRGELCPLQSHLRLTFLVWKWCFSLFGKELFIERALWVINERLAAVLVTFLSYCRHTRQFGRMPKHSLMQLVRQMKNALCFHFNVLQNPSHP